MLGSVLRLAIGSTIGPGLIIVAGFTDGSAQAALWTIALALDYLGGAFSSGGWRVSPGHFAERHGLIIIIALGESIVAIGVGARGAPLDTGEITAALLGIAVVTALWWTYFDVVALVAERKLSALRGVAQASLARDTYSYLHLPMVAGIVLFALAVKKTLAHFGDDLDTVTAAALCCGRRCTSSPTTRCASGRAGPTTDGGCWRCSRFSRCFRSRSRCRGSLRWRQLRPSAGPLSHGRRCATRRPGLRFATPSL